MTKETSGKWAREVFWGSKLSSAPVSWRTVSFGFARTVEDVREHVVCLPGS